MYNKIYSTLGNDFELLRVKNMVIKGGFHMPKRGENIRKRKDNRWEGRYIQCYDINGKAKYKSVYAKSYLEVKRKLVEINDKSSKNALPLKEQALSFREVLYLWLDNNKLKLREQTYAKYMYLIESHILPQIGLRKLNEIDCTYINHFLSEKSKCGRLDGKGGLSPSYIKTIAFIMSSALKFAAENGYCASFNGEIAQPVKRAKELDILSVTEQTKLERYVLSNIDDKKIGILLSLYMGLRIGEVCGLKWEDVDFLNGTLHVRHTVERIKNLNANLDDSKTILVLGETKTISSNRTIPIPSNMLLLLKKYKQKNNLFILRGSTYDYTDPRTYQYSFHKILQKCNLRDINYHALRHTFATRCVESGMDIKSLSEILGHASVNITLNTYVHSSLDHKRNQLESMYSFCGQQYGQQYSRKKEISAFSQ